MISAGLFNKFYFICCTAQFWLSSIGINVNLSRNLNSSFWSITGVFSKSPKFLSSPFGTDKLTVYRSIAEIQTWNRPRMQFKGSKDKPVDGASICASERVACPGGSEDVIWSLCVIWDHPRRDLWRYKSHKCGMGRPWHDKDVDQSAVIAEITANGAAWWPEAQHMHVVKWGMRLASDVAQLIVRLAPVRWQSA